MSTTIYNGFHFKGSMVELQPVLNDLRKAIQPEFTKELLNQAFGYIVSLYDLSTFIDKESLMNFLSHGIDDEPNEDSPFLRYAIQNMEHYKKDLLGEQVVVVFPYDDENTYLYPFGSKRTMRAFEESEHFHSFGYWDNVDMEEGVSDEEWEHRKDVWSEIFNRAGTSVFGEAGFSFPIYDKLPTVALAQSKNHGQTEESRLKRMKHFPDFKGELYPNLPDRILNTRIKDLYPDSE